MNRLCVFVVALGVCSCRFNGIDPMSFDPTRFGDAMPQGFLLGAATSAHQIEGGNSNDWTRWEQAKEAPSSGDACLSWSKWSEDIELLKALGCNAYRLSVEWSRLQSTQLTALDPGAVQNYRALLQALHDEGITANVTLYHFTLPIWFADAGGWESERAVELFGDFVRRCAEQFGDLVDFWCTVNEPNVVAMQSYIIGTDPPGVKDTVRATQVYATLLEAHAAAATELRSTDIWDADGDGQASRVGLAHHVRGFQPATTAQLDSIIGAITDEYWNDAVPRAIETGRIYLVVPGEIVVDRVVPALADSCDYLGINYYTRDLIRADLGDPALSQQYPNPEGTLSDLDWEIFPEGLEDLLVRYGSYGWPMYILENGTSDRIGSFRPDYIRGHLLALERAVRRGADVRGYFHWSLMDNFEWNEGYSTDARFGLYAVDFEDPDRTRTPRPSVTLFQEVARGLGLLPR